MTTFINQPIPFTENWDSKTFIENWDSKRHLWTKIYTTLVWCVQNLHFKSKLLFEKFSLIKNVIMNFIKSFSDRNSSNYCLKSFTHQNSSNCCLNDKLLFKKFSKFDPIWTNFILFQPNIQNEEIFFKGEATWQMPRSLSSKLCLSLKRDTFDLSKPVPCQRPIKTSTRSKRAQTCIISPPRFFSGKHILGRGGN